MAKSLNKILNWTPSSLILFSFWSAFLVVCFLLFQYQKNKFLIIVSGLSFLFLGLILTPTHVAILSVWFSQLLPMASLITISSTNIRPMEFVFIITMISWVFFIFLPQKRKIRKVFGIIEYSALVFIIFLAIAVIRGILGNQYSGDFGGSFRADTFRGSIYYIYVLFFAHLLSTYERFEEKLILHWFLASFGGIGAYIVIASARTILGLPGRFGGVNTQLFVISGGFAFALGLLMSKKWWLLSILYISVMVYMSVRTIFAGYGIIVLLIVLAWIIIQKSWKERLRIIIWSVVIALASVFSLFALFEIVLRFTQSESVIGLAYRMGVLLQPENIRYVPSLQWRLLEILESIQMLKNSSIFWGTGMGSKFSVTLLGNNMIDNTYFMVLCKWGISGFISFMFMYSAFTVIIYKLLRNIDKFESTVIKAYILTCAGAIPTIAIMGITACHLVWANATIITISAFMAISSCLWRRLKTDEISARDRA